MKRSEVQRAYIKAGNAINNSMRGSHNHASGSTFEDIINETNEFYRQAKFADVDKTPEPLRVIKRLPNGHFECIFTKKAQPDYTGVKKSADADIPLAVKFEAKHTETDRIKQSTVTDEQARRLDGYENDYGAQCFVLVSFGYKLFYKIPWSVFRSMKENYGRKYMLPEEMKRYKVKYQDGVLDYLGYFNKYEDESAS